MLMLASYGQRLHYSCMEGAEPVPKGLEDRSAEQIRIEEVLSGYEVASTRIEIEQLTSKLAERKAHLEELLRQHQQPPPPDP